MLYINIYFIYKYIKFGMENNIVNHKIKYI